MADIIRLADRRHETIRRITGEAGPVQILLFTGVRYERLEPVSKRPGAGSKRPGTRTSKRG